MLFENTANLVQYLSKYLSAVKRKDLTTINHEEIEDVLMVGMKCAQLISHYTAKFRISWEYSACKARGYNSAINDLSDTLYLMKNYVDSINKTVRRSGTKTDLVDRDLAHMDRLLNVIMDEVDNVLDCCQKKEKRIKEESKEGSPTNPNNEVSPFMDF